MSLSFKGTFLLETLSNEKRRNSFRIEVFFTYKVTMMKGKKEGKLPPKHETVIHTSPKYAEIEDDTM